MSDMAFNLVELYTSLTKRGQAYAELMKETPANNFNALGSIPVCSELTIHHYHDGSMIYSYTADKQAVAIDGRARVAGVRNFC
jgi:hypothetical protein